MSSSDDDEAGLPVFAVLNARGHKPSETSCDVIEYPHVHL